MKVDLAYPWTDDKGTEHPPDKTVEVSDVVGDQLIRDGRARRSAASTARAATPRKPRPPAKKAAAKATRPKAPAPGADNTKEAGS